MCPPRSIRPISPILPMRPIKPAMQTAQLSPTQRRSFRPKDPFCGLSHLAGAILSTIGLVALLVIARGRPWHTVAFAIYGATLILLYTASSLYHSLNVHERGVEFL